MEEYIYSVSVKAFEIGKIEEVKVIETPTYLITSKDEDSYWMVNQGYIDTHNPQIGGGFIVYDDKTLSYAPPTVFSKYYQLVKKK